MSYGIRSRKRVGPPYTAKIVNTRSCGHWEIYDYAKKTWVNGGNLYYPVSPAWTYVDDCLDETHPGPPYKSGGPCAISHARCSDSSPTVMLEKKPYRYSVTCYTNIGGALFGSDTDPASGYSWLSTAQASSYGPTGWNKFKPGKPKAELAVFLAELRDFKHLFKIAVSKLYQLRHIANLHLAIQFGWRPLLNDLRKFYKTFSDCDKVMQYLLRNNNRWVHRGGIVEETSDSKMWSNAAVYMQPILPSPFYLTSSPTPHPISVKRHHIAWFEASFRYFIPDIGTKSWKDRTIRKLYGLDVTPAVVWELIPWSWCVDWFTNLGDCLSNLSTGLVENLDRAYAFVMLTSTVNYTADLYQIFKTDNGTVGVAMNAQRSWERKSRANALPFLLDLSDALLSLRQISILGALGIQRFHR